MSDSPIPIPSGLKGTTIAGDQGSLDLYTMLEGFFRMGRNLRLWPLGKIAGPFEKFWCSGKEEAMPGGGIMKHNALRFMITQFRAGKLHSCLYYSSDRPCSLGGVF